MANDFVIGPKGPYTGTNPNAVSINGAAIYLPNRNNPAVTVVNTGSAVVFLDNEDPINNPSSGQPLSPGSSIGWDAANALYATCATSTTITITRNSGNIFDAGAVAAAIIDQGLAGDIAAAISITGAPPIDKYTLLASSGAFTGTYQSALVDVSSYQSLQVYPVQGLPVSYLVVTVQWFDSTQLILLGQDSVIIGAGQSGNAQYANFPVRGAYARVLGNDTFGAGGGTLPFQIRTFGSYKTADYIRQIGYGRGSVNGVIDGSATVGIQTWSGILPVGATWLWEPDFSPGPAHLTLRFTGASQITMLVRIPTSIYALTTYASETNLVTSAGLMKDYDLLLPPVPLEMSITNTHASATQTFRANWTFKRPY